LYAWGDNANGQLGLNDTVKRSSPVQVGALTTWAQLAIGSTHTIATKVDGTLWSWGSSNQGQLGLNDTVNRSSPVQVGALTTWYQVASGSAFTLATKTDGTLWAWGYNGNGQLGLGDAGALTKRSSPVQVGALTTWYQVAAGSAFTLATKTDGTLWSWGNNSNGQLGQNNTTYHSSPVQIGALTNWSRISAGAGKFCLAIKTDGTLWSWGYNDFGTLGQNDTVNRSSPVQVGSLTNWYQVAAGNNHCIATKADGTLWSWGVGGNGQLGLGNTTYRSSPVQVGALTTWSRLAKMPMSDSSLALKTP
jgi:alpha-tubulin suppressor-like RCC1 family protein